MFEFNIPTGFNITAQGCGTPLPWGGNRPQFPFTPTGLRHIGANTIRENRRNSVGVEKREGETLLTRGCGAPLPRAVLLNPVGILNIYVSISMSYPERKDVGNDKNCILERTCRRNCISRPRSIAPMCMMPDFEAMKCNFINNCIPKCKFGTSRARQLQCIL